MDTFTPVSIYQNQKTISSEYRTILLITERMAEEQNSIGYVSPPGMNRQLRSGSLNIYLNEMIRCLASSARPR